MTLGSLSRLAVLLGDAPRAAEFYARLLPYADLVLVHDMLHAVSDPVAAVLGHLCLVLRRCSYESIHCLLRDQQVPVLVPAGYQ